MLASVPGPNPITPAPPKALPAKRGLPLLYALAALWLLLWMMIAMVEVAILFHTPRVPHWHPISMVLISTGMVAGWLAWALATHRFERVPLDPPGRWLGYHLRALPLLIVIGVPLNMALYALVFRLIGTNYGYAPPLHIKIPFDSVKIALFYGLWLALMFGLLTLAKWREDSERMLGVQKALAEAQLAQLQSQLRPHFLFNALNTVSSLMTTDVARADRVLSQLGDLLRASLASGRPDLVPLRDELKVLQKYADIMHERFEERATVTWQIAADVLDLRMPSMLLQPLLENAYKHGVERNTAPVHICVSASRAGNSLHMEVHNTGSNLSAPSSEEGGVGLNNCRERLRLLYGDAATLTVVDDPAGGVRASVRLPCPPAA